MPKKLDHLNDKEKEALAYVRREMEFWGRSGVGRQWRVTKEQMCGLKQGEENVQVTKDSKRKLNNNVSMRVREGESFTFRSVKAAMEALWGLEKDTPTQQKDWAKLSYDYHFRGVRWRRTSGREFLDDLWPGSNTDYHVWHRGMLRHDTDCADKELRRFYNNRSDRTDELARYR